MLQDLKNIENWDLSKKRKFFWSFSIIWVITIFLIGGEWLYFIPFIVGDIIFWKGHVGVANGKSTIIHANGDTNNVAIENSNKLIH